MKKFEQFLVETQLIKNNNAEFIGRFGWWNVYTNINRNIDYKNIERVCTESVHRLSAMGIPRQRGIIFITDLSHYVNPITGGRTGGLAHWKEHGISIDINNLNPDIIVHEQAHMIWKNLPQASKEYFRKWYRKNIDVIRKEQPATSDRWQELVKGLDKKKVSEEIKNRIQGFAQEMLVNARNYLGRDINSYINLLTSQPGDEAFHHSVKSMGETVKVKLKQRMEFTNYRGYRRVVEPGADVYLERLNNNKYVLNWYDGHNRYETDIYTVNNKISDFVSSVNDSDKEALELKNAKVFSFLADPHKRTEIGEWFWKSATSFAKHLNLFGRWESGEYTPKDIFLVHGPDDFYTTWAAIIRLRGKNIKDVGDVYRAIVDTFTRKLMPFNILIKAPIGKVPNIDVSSLDKPAASLHRGLAHKRGLVPDSYAASNPDELWASSIENASKNMKSISPQLKKAILNTISGDFNV